MSPASKEQRKKVAGRLCVECGAAGCDPAHLTARAQGGCECAECVIPLCRFCHRKFDTGFLDLEPIIALPEFAIERAHMALHMSYRSAIKRLNGWAT